MYFKYTPTMVLLFFLDKAQRRIKLIFVNINFFVLPWQGTKNNKACFLCIIKTTYEWHINGHKCWKTESWFVIKIWHSCSHLASLSLVARVSTRVSMIRVASWLFKNANKKKKRKKEYNYFHQLVIRFLCWPCTCTICLSFLC